MDESPIVEAVAVVGMAGRFPGASSVERFWTMLRDGVEGLSRFTPEALIEAGVPSDVVRIPAYVPVKGVVDGADLFDAAFFGYTPREAELMDPQQRIMLECGWEALEHAGYDPRRYEGSIGVYAGVGVNTYLLSQLSGVMASDAAAGYQVFIGNDKDFLATRLSYKLGLRGPSLVVQTACSTSLVAIHLAVRSLLAHECDMALAGGVSAGFPHTRGYQYQEGMILSPDGHCRSFDEKAAGTVPAEGAGVVVLRRLSEALADGDNVLAVIKGTAINNDGAAKAGYTAPSVDGQAEVIAMAQAVADVHPDTITYVEAHGTATPLGDPIEIAALTRAFRTATDRRAYCAIGSLKSNIGHLDTAAGVAGLMKTVLALRHRQIPPSLHFERPNPALELDTSPFFVNTHLADWHSPSGPRRAGVSSFGIGGTNAHAILEEAPSVAPGDQPMRRAEVLTLSARSEETLAAAARQLAAFLTTDPSVPLADVAHTLQVGRRTFEYRRTVVCQSRDAAIAALDADGVTRIEERTDRGAVFMFPGQGSQRPGMARVLYATEPAFRDALDACLGALEPSLGAELHTLLCAPRDDDASAARLAHTVITQPAIFSVEYALAQLWRSWGIEPEAMVGHSIGEYVAACLAGVFELKDAVALVAMRGRLMQGVRPGAMLAVPLPASEVGDLLRDGLELAAVNAPALCSLAGSVEDVDRVQHALEARGIPARRLQTSHAFHSSHMDSVLATFTEYVASVTRREPSIPFISGVSGTWIRHAEATDPRYWAMQLRQPVQFAKAVGELGHGRVFLEVGPGRALATLVRQAGASYQDVVVSLEQPCAADADTRLLSALADLWRAGCGVNWTMFRRGERRLRAALPTYPFNRQRYFVERPAAPAVSQPAESRSTRLDPARWLHVPSWRRASNLQPADRSDASHHWLVIEDAGGIASQVAAALAASGAAVTRVRVATAFGQTADGVYTVDPGSSTDVERLVDAAWFSAGPIDRIAHFGALDSDPCMPDSGVRGLVFYLPLYVARTILARSTAPCRLAMISTGVQSVLGDEVLDAAKATLLGVCRVLPQEYSHCTTAAIDVSTAHGDDPTLIGLLASELGAAQWAPVVALRGRHRWVQEFEPYDAPSGTAGGRLKQDGVYLITGGAGEMGVALAEHLTSLGIHPKLAILGRSTLSAGAPLSGRRAARLARLRATEEAGSEVLLLTADVSCHEEVTRAVAATRARFGRIDGVFHLAGQIGAVAIEAVTPDAVEEQFRPKLEGLRALSAALAGERLDFATVASSISSVLGGLGFAAYAGANASADAFALTTPGVSGPQWTSVNWDAWVFDEEGAAAQGLRAQLIHLAITPAEGSDAWVRIVNDQGLRQVIVSTSNLKARQSAATASAPRAASTTEPSRPSPAHARPALTSTYVEPRNEMETAVAAIWQELLGVGQIGVDDDFFELGGHSLLAVQIATRIRARYRVELPLKRLFEATTIAKLADDIGALVWASEGALAAAGGGSEDREEISL
jgi:acyl transferase domain-containing protein